MGSSEPLNPFPNNSLSPGLIGTSFSPGLAAIGCSEVLVWYQRLNPKPAGPNASAGFDQLQHLGAEATGTALEVEGFKDRLGGAGDVADLGAATGLFMQA